MCGTEDDIPRLIKSTGNQMLVHFHSDFNQHWRDQGYELQILEGINYHQFILHLNHLS